MDAVLLMIGLYFAGCIALIVVALRRDHKEPDDLTRIIEEIETAPLHDGGLLMRETPNPAIRSAATGRHTHSG